MDQALRMDRIYGLQRHIYDATRWCYLLGRDRLLANLPAPRGGSVLEMGCGTGRNLKKLARLRPDLSLHGLDVSSCMLETAQGKLRYTSARLACCTAEGLDCAGHFQRPEGFDAVIFSYALSMIPDWRSALEAGYDAVKPGGVLAIVDFWGKGGLPPWLNAAHEWWLGLFGVHFKPELIEHITRTSKSGDFRLRMESVRGGYAFLAWIDKPA